MTVICQALALLFAIVALSQPGAVHYDYATVARSAR